MEASRVRVLVVDDYEPFRRFNCATVSERQDMQVIGEASDGLDAIRKAEKLTPDLIARFPKARVVIGVDHKNYGHMAVLGEDTRAALAKDFS